MAAEEDNRNSGCTVQEDVNRDQSDYLRQVNGVNGRDTVFSVCVCVQRTGESDQFKMVKATDFKFDLHVPRDSPDMTP